MRTLLVGLNPGGIVGMAPFYLKAYYVGRIDAAAARDITIVGYDVAHDARLAIVDFLRFAPDVLGFSCYVWNVERVLEICGAVRSELPGTKILLGGPEASPRALEILQRHPCVDAVVVGEGEITFAEILQRWGAGERNLRGLRGVTYRGRVGVHANETRPVIRDLAKVPSPFLSGIIQFDLLKGYLFGYETFRGCPFNCSFCYWGRMLSVRYFPMERVRQELAVILKSSLRRMWVGDSVANLHRNRFKEFLRTVIELDTDTVIDFEMVADLLDDETIELLGCLRDGYVAFGLQSINDRALVSINRRWKRDLFTRNVRQLRQRTAKIKIYIDLIYGLPEDNLQGYERSIRYAMSLLPQKIQPHPLLLLPGSPLFDHPQTYGIVFEEKAPHHVIENSWWSKADIQAAREWSDKLFFFFNPAVNLTTNMASQILDEDPFDVFLRLHKFMAGRFDCARVATDLGIPRELALQLNDALEEFIAAELRDPHQVGFREPLIDVMAFAGCRTMFYAAELTSDFAPLRWSANDTLHPLLSPDVVLKRFRHDMSPVYRNNFLRSPTELLRFQPRTYDIVFNLRTHAVYHVSEHVSDLLAACSGASSLTELANGLANRRQLAVDARVLREVQQTFEELANKRIVISAPVF